MERPVRGFGIFIIGFAICAAYPPSVAATDVFDVLRAWSSREDRVKTAEVTWLERETFPKESRESSDQKVKLPAQDTTKEVQARFDLAENKMRFSYDGWAIGKTDIVKYSYKNSVSLDKSKSFRTDASVDQPMGTVYGEQRLERARETRLLPILMFLRPLHKSGYNFKATDFTVSPRTEYVNGDICFQLTRTIAGAIESWFIDLKKDAVIRRFEIKSGETVRNKIDIEYQQDGDGTWKPKGWRTILRNKNGELVYGSVAEIKTCEFNQKTGTEQIVRASSERFERATVVALDPIVLLVASN
jgi:hypothetical protein